MPTAIRRINLFGRPGAGKSTAAAEIYNALKKEKFNIELVNEYVKTWVYMGREIKSFDQVYIFGKQLHAEDKILTSGVQFIVTDSPLLIQYCYATLSKDQIMDELYSMAMKFDKAFPSINILLKGNMNSPEEYVQHGRCHDFQNSLLAGDIMDSVLEAAYPEGGIIIHHGYDYTGLIQHIKELVNKG